MAIKQKHYKIWLIGVHIVFWSAIFSLLMLVYNGILGSVEPTLLATVTSVISFIILIYVNLFLLIPKLLNQKRYIAYGLGLLLLLAVIASLRFYVGWGLVKAWYPEIQHLFKPSYFGSIVSSSAFFLIIAIPFRMVDNWLKKQELEKELKTHQLEAELRFLKAQVNPHFLFNALNNIYALSFTESKKAPEMILRLSDMMSYMLYDCKQEKVSLSSEVAYLRNYIDLQQLKKEGEFNIDFEVDGNIASIFITPMLFIPLFENAFKHGNLEDTQAGWLKSRLEVQEDQLLFSIANSKKVQHKTAAKGGVGLENLKDRLKLLFPEQHTLKIEEEKEVYTVLLTINLNQNEL